MTVALTAWLGGVVDGLALPDLQLRGVELDSRRIRPGGAFVAVAGSRVDGAAHIDAAFANGALVALRDGHQATVLQRPDGRIEVTVPGLPGHIGRLAALYYNDPSADLDLIGVTGTNGKTTVASLVAQALSALGQPAGVLGTLGAGFPGNLCTTTGLTTADPFTINRCLASLRRAGARAVAMEVSSHGLDQDRVAGLHFDVAAFTNLTRDHLDYHGDMAAYAAAKRRLFEQPGLRAAAINVDDATGAAFAAELTGQLAVQSCALDAPAAVRLTDARLDSRGQQAVLAMAGGHWPLRTSLLGRFNLANLVVVAGVLRAMGHSGPDIARALAGVTAVAGRMQAFVASNGAMVVVDYAHTPDALEQALAALRPHVGAGGELCCVFGCGGDRDRGKRPLMAAAASRLADRVLVTDDNPRSEDGDAIVADITAGMGKTRCSVQRNRGAAIADALAAAGPQDVVLVAGKGHEDYQEVAGIREPFSDITTVQLLLAAENNSGGAG